MPTACNALFQRATSSELLKTLLCNRANMMTQSTFAAAHLWQPLQSKVRISTAQRSPKSLMKHERHYHRSPEIHARF